MSGYRKIAAALVLFAVGAVSSAAAAQCIPAGEGQQMVAQGQVLPLPTALQNAGLAGVQVLKVQLCHSGGGWAYRVRYRQGGAVSSATVPAG
jgi:hypothetical protein